MVSNNAYDNCCFRGDYANAPLMWAARPYFALYKAADELTAHINYDAGHNYGQENREAFYRFVRDHFYAGNDSAFSDEGGSVGGRRQDARSIAGGTAG
ncbi:MAG: hypothetical protein QM757_29435 [Paludibaculum sp.]